MIQNTHAHLARDEASGGQVQAAKWECRDGTTDEDHNWRCVAGDPSTGEGDYMECRECGKTREATAQEVADAWNDYHLQDWSES